MTAYFKTGTFLTGINSWHGEENRLKVARIQPGDNVTEAMRKGRMLDIEAIVCPTIVELPNGRKLKMEKGQLVLAGVPWTKDGFQPLNRQVTWYKAIQNREYAEILDPLANTYQIVGTLMVGKYGETVIVQMEMPDFYVQDNELEGHKVFLTVTEDRRTGNKHYGTSITRVVCQNTYFAAIGSGLKSLPNGADAKYVLEFRTRLEQHMIEQRNQEREWLNHLFTTSANDDLFSKVAETLFPAPQVHGLVELVEQAQATNMVIEADSVISRKNDRAVADYDRAVVRRSARMTEFFERVNQFNDEHPYAANTAYAAWQAATGFMNHSQQLQSPTDVAAYNLFFGDRAKALTEVRKVLSK